MSVYAPRAPGTEGLSAPLELPAVAGSPLTTQGGSTLDDGSGDATISGLVTGKGYATSSPAVTTPAITSGVAFVPNATEDSSLCLTVDAAVAGSVEVTMGPSTGAEYSFGTQAMLAGSDDIITVPVPAGWKVVVTLTSTTVSALSVNV